MSEEISYKLDAYEGPLDLLLHLIEKDKINIYDIPIADITNQYLAYMDQLGREDLNIMSDFLVMAATLLDIKASMLLPAEVDPETGEEVDPRTELVERLIEYKKAKAMAQELRDMLFDAEKRLYKEPTIPKEVARYEKPVDLNELLGDVTLNRLQDIFNQVMKKSIDRIDPERSKFGTIEKEKVSLETKLKSLVDYTKAHKKFSFRNVLETQPSRLEVVVTFLAILELTKIGRLHIEQDEQTDDLRIEVLEVEGETELDLKELEDFT